MISIITPIRQFEVATTYYGQPIFVPEWAQWIATDSCGNIWAYEEEPIQTWKQGTFHIGKGRSVRVGIGLSTTDCAPYQTVEKIKTGS